MPEWHTTADDIATRELELRLENWGRAYRHRHRHPDHGFTLSRWDAADAARGYVPDELDAEKVEAAMVTLRQTHERAYVAVWLAHMAGMGDATGAKAMSRGEVPHRRPGERRKRGEVSPRRFRDLLKRGYALIAGELKGEAK